MLAQLYWIDAPTGRRLAILARPRGGDWLEDEVRSWRGQGIDVVVSLLTPAEILSLLLPRYVNTVIFACLLESSASEHAARRRAMKAATDSGEELIKVYTRIANRDRSSS